jgi:maltooligosyltrehalose trehalohydrolase
VTGPVAARVWAPDAERLGLETDGATFAMERAPGGWWSGPASGPGSLRHGTDYAFRIDGDGPFPDPRSRWQPAGIHGPSRWLGEDIDWSDAGWQAPPIASGVIYELHIGTFSTAGTFDGAIERLDALIDLGVTHVEVMPIAPFPGRHGWGYDGVFPMAVHEPYGGPLAFRRFVDACHRRGLAVILDVVYNHLGPDGNVLPRFGPYLTDRHRTPWGEAVNLDGPGSDEVRRFIIDDALARFRLDHVDGLRLDAVHALSDLSALHFLEELATETAELERELGRPLLLVAESDLNDPRLVRDRSVGGFGIHAAWSDDLHHALHVTLTGERTGYYADFAGFGDLVTALRDVYVYAGRYSAFRDRRHGRPVGDLSRDRFLGYLQDHDQVGNRARGERSSQILDPPALKVAAAIVLLGPYVPMLFAGEEWAASTPFPYFTDHEDAELARAVSQGRREEFAAFGWRLDEVPDPQDPATFESARLDWAERDREPHAGILSWHRACIAARRRHPALAAGPAATVRADLEARWLVVERPGSRLAVNLGAAPATIELPEGPWRLELASEDDVEAAPGRIGLPPMRAALMLRPPAASKGAALRTGEGTAGGPGHSGVCADEAMLPRW